MDTNEAYARLYGTRHERPVYFHSSSSRDSLDYQMLNDYWNSMQGAESPYSIGWSFDWLTEEKEEVLSFAW